MGNSASSWLTSDFEKPADCIYFRQWVVRLELIKNLGTLLNRNCLLILQPTEKVLTSNYSNKVLVQGLYVTKLKRSPYRKQNRTKLYWKLESLSFSFCYKARINHSSFVVRCVFNITVFLQSKTLLIFRPIIYYILKHLLINRVFLKAMQGPQCKQCFVYILNKTIHFGVR